MSIPAAININFAGNLKRNLFHILLSLLIAGSIFQVIPGLFDNPEVSMIISISFITILSGLAAMLLPLKRKNSIAVPDIFIALWFLGIVLSRPASNLWFSGYLCLLFYYVIIRFAGFKINYRIVYFIIHMAIFALSILGYLQYTGIYPSYNSC
ncbi:MAG: hypothetical protein AB2L24_15565 [Mangrovibacterium sp.]